MKISRATVAPTLATHNTDNWPQELRDNFINVYGNDFQKMWDGYIDFCKVYINAFPRGCWTDQLHDVRCPVLIFHGDMVSPQLLIL